MQYSSSHIFFDLIFCPKADEQTYCSTQFFYTVVNKRVGCKT